QAHSLARRGIVRNNGKQCHFCDAKSAKRICMHLPHGSSRASRLPTNKNPDDLRVSGRKISIYHFAITPSGRHTQAQNGSRLARAARARPVRRIVLWKCPGGSNEKAQRE